MLALFDTLLRGARARAEDRATDAFAIELLDQKVRDAEGGLTAAKGTLAGLVMRLRREREALADVERRIAELESRAREALRAGSDDLAGEAAGVIAEMEGERGARRATVERIEARAARMRLSIERAHRRLVSLRQGALTARSVNSERLAQGRLHRSLHGSPHGSMAASDFEEAEALVERVMRRADPLEEAEVREEIERDLSGAGVAERMAEAGFGAATRPRADDVLARLKRDIRDND